MRIFHYGRYKAAALKQNDTYHPESKTMTQIGGVAVTLMLLLTASLLFQDTTAWGKVYFFLFSVISMQLEN